MSQQPDHYQVLGVSPDAEDVVVRGAYRAMMHKYHPDRFAGSAAEGDRMAKALNAAYAVLGDPKARARYDQQRKVSGSRTTDGASSGPTAGAKRRTNRASARHDLIRLWLARAAASRPPPYVWAGACFFATLAVGLVVSLVWPPARSVAPPAAVNAVAASAETNGRTGATTHRRRVGGEATAGAGSVGVDQVLATASAGGRPMDRAFYRQLAISASQEDALYVQGVEAEQNGLCEVVASKVYELSDIADRRIVTVSGVEVLRPADATLKAHILTLKALEQRCKAASAAFRNQSRNQ